MYHHLDRNNFMFDANINGTKVTIIESQYCSSLIDIDLFIHKVLSTDKPAFHFTRNKNGSITTEKLALSKYFDCMLPYQSCFSKKYWYSEHCELFFRCIDELGLWGFPKGKPDINTTGTNKTDGECFNDLLELIRKKSLTNNFKRRLNQRLKNSENNFQSARSYIDKLFSKHSKLLVVRVNPGYLEMYSSKITLEEAQKDLKRFLGNWRCNKIFEHCVGYIWKLEMGDLKGFHFHLVLFFNGNEVQNEELHASNVNTYWMKVIADGRGLCSDSNRRKDHADHHWVGMIGQSDSEKRENLLKAIKYLTKTEQYIKLKTSPKTRVFGRGEMLELPEIPRGRPRMKISPIESSADSQSANAIQSDLNPPTSPEISEPVLR